MRAHYLQHVAFEGLGSIETWLLLTGYDISCTRFYADDNLPDLNEIDLLIVMGGPMSVNDEQEFPWLVTEKAFVRDAIHKGIPVLGVCLGAQLIASAMGARVYPNPFKEIGWFPIFRTVTSNSSTCRIPDTLEVFHWHGETFELPANAVRLASSKACENQAFQLGGTVIGLQFHLETTATSARDIVEHCRHELVADQYVQTEASILSIEPGKYSAVNQLMDSILVCITSKS